MFAIENSPKPSKIGITNLEDLRTDLSVTTERLVQASKKRGWRGKSENLTRLIILKYAAKSMLCDFFRS
jgi:hypothetical protein